MTVLRQTHTFVVLDLEPATFREIAAKLVDAGYDHAFVEQDGRTVIDMQGIALAETDKPKPVDVEGEKVAKIKRLVAAEFRISLAHLENTKRGDNTQAMVRGIAMWLCRRHTDMSLNEVGQKFGGRNHGTVKHMIEQVENVRETEPRMKDKIDRVEEAFKR